MKEVDAQQPIVVRRFEIGDEPDLWRIYYEATHQCNSQDYHLELIERWAPSNQDVDEWADRVQGTRPFVAEIGGVPVGFAELDADGFIDYFYCHPDWQRRGVGSCLLDRIETEGRENGIMILSAAVSITAKSFFLAKGFQIVRARENIIDGHAAPNFDMAKQLD